MVVVKNEYGSFGFYDRHRGRKGLVTESSDSPGCWGPCYTMSSHAALGVVRAGVAVLKGEKSLAHMSNRSARLTVYLQALGYE